MPRRPGDDPARHGCATSAGPGCPQRRGIRAGSAAGGGHHVCVGVGRVPLARGGPRRVEPQGRGLVAGEPSAGRAGISRLGSGFGPAASARPDPSWRPGMPIYASGVRPSMGSVGDAYDNAMAESFFLTLEAELLSRRRRFTSQTEARMACFSDIEGWYNPPGRTRAWATGRLRSHTGGRSGPGVARKPDQAERQAASMA